MERFRIKFMISVVINLQDPVRHQQAHAAFENAHKREYSWNAIPDRFTIYLSREHTPNGQNNPDFPRQSTKGHSSIVSSNQRF